MRVFDAFFKLLIAMAQKIFMIRCFDDLFETLNVLGGGEGVSFLVFFYTIEGVFLDIIINTDYLIEFQVPLYEYTPQVFNFF